MGWVLQAGSRGRRNAPQLQGCTGGLKETPEIAHCLPSLQMLQHILLGLSAEPGVDTGHGFPHEEKTEVQYMKSDSLRREAQEDLTLMPPGRSNR